MKQIIAKMPNMHDFYFSQKGGIAFGGWNGSTLGRVDVDGRIRHLHVHLHRLLLGSEILLLCRRVEHLLLVLLSIGRRRVTGYGGGLAACQWRRLP